jgi:hypothetical protein
MGVNQEQLKSHGTKLKVKIYFLVMINYLIMYISRMIKSPVAMTMPTLKFYQSPEEGEIQNDLVLPTGL